MNTVKTFILFFIFAFCLNSHAQTISKMDQTKVADKTAVDMTGSKLQAQMFETCQAELERAKLDPEKYLTEKEEKINNMLADAGPLAYWETYALSELLKTGSIKDAQKVNSIARCTTDVLELVNEHLKSADKNGKDWGFLYTIVDFISQKFYSASDYDVYASELSSILTSIAVGYGEKSLDIDGNLADKPAITDYSISKFGIISPDDLSKSRGLAAIEYLSKRTDDKVAPSAMESLMIIASAEKAKYETMLAQATADNTTAPSKTNIESISILKGLAYYNPFAFGPTYFTVIDTQRGEKNAIEYKQAQAVAYLGMLGETEFLNNYLSTGTNKLAQNNAALFLKKDAPNPYYNVTSTIGNGLMTVRDLGMMSAYPEVAWETTSFSAADGWASSKLVNPSYVREFSDVSEYSVKINSGLDGVGIATWQIPAMSEFIPFVSNQCWTIPAAIKSTAVMKSFLYIVRAIPTTAILVDQGKMYKIDVTNKKVTLMDNAAATAVDKNKSYITVVITLADGTKVNYLIWANTKADSQEVLNYIASTGAANPGIKAEINYRGPSQMSPTKTLAKTPVNTDLTAATEKQITDILDKCNLSVKEQTNILDAFKSRTSLSNPESVTKFMDGNSVYTNIEVFTNPNGATVLKVVRGLSTSTGLINFNINFTYDADGNVTRTNEIEDAANAAQKTAVTDKVAADLDEKISDYDKNCKNL